MPDMPPSSPSSASLPSHSYLPTELWSQVFDSLDFSALLVASHVCRLLQSSAHGHPKFWRDIELPRANVKQLKLFCLRLQPSQLEGRYICLRIVLDAPFQRRGRMRIHSQVLRETLGAISRVRHLDIECAMGLHSELNDILESPMPQLCTLRVRLLDSRGGDDFDGRLPRRFLSGHAPLLHSVELDGYYRANEDTGRGFTTVQRVVCSGYLLEQLPSLFPNVAELILGPRELDPAELEEDARQFLLQVPRITFDGSVDETEGPSAAAIDFLAARTEYTLLDVEIGQLLQSLKLLNGPLALICCIIGGGCDVREPLTFMSLVDGQARVFIDTGRTDNSSSLLFELGEPESVEMACRIKHCTIAIGSHNGSPNPRFDDIRQRVLQYLPAMTELTVYMVGTCIHREYSWPMAQDLEVQSDWRSGSEIAEAYSGEPQINSELAIPYCVDLQKLLLKADVLSRTDAEGLVVAARYLVERISDLEVVIQTNNRVETSVLNVLEAQFRVVNVRL